MRNKYIIDENRLKSLLESEAILECLYQDGIDDWIGFLVGKKEYLFDAIKSYENKINKEEFNDMFDDIDNSNFGFDDLAELELNDFERY
jgi:hypothetical protein